MLYGWPYGGLRRMLVVYRMRARCAGAGSEGEYEKEGDRLSRKDYMHVYSLSVVATAVNLLV